MKLIRAAMKVTAPLKFFDGRDPPKLYWPLTVVHVLNREPVCLR